MNKAQELWLRTNGWTNTTERWDTVNNRWAKDSIDIRIKNNKAYMYGFPAVGPHYDIGLKTVQILNRLSKQ